MPKLAARHHGLLVRVNHAAHHLIDHADHLAYTHLHPCHAICAALAALVALSHR